MAEIGTPQPGLFRIRLVRNGPWVAARILHEPDSDPVTGEEMDRSWLWSAEINGSLIAPPSPSPLHAGVFRIWGFGRSIENTEYLRLLGNQDTPDRPLDLHAKAPLF